MSRQRLPQTERERERGVGGRCSAARSRPAPAPHPGHPVQQSGQAQAEGDGENVLGLTKLTPLTAEDDADPRTYVTYVSSHVQDSAEGRKVRWAPAQRSCVQRTLGRVGRSEAPRSFQFRLHPNLKEAAATKLASLSRCQAPRRGTSAMTFAWHSAKGNVIITQVVARGKASALGEAAQLPPAAHAHHGTLRKLGC